MFLVALVLVSIKLNAEQGVPVPLQLVVFVHSQHVALELNLVAARAQIVSH